MDYTHDPNHGFYYSTDNFDTTPAITDFEPYCFSALFRVVPKTTIFKFYSQIEANASYMEWLRSV